MPIYSKEYKGFSIPRHKRKSLSVKTNPKVVDSITKSIRSLGQKACFIALSDDNILPGNKYTSSNQGDNETRTHIQGMQRVDDGKHFLLAGGDSYEFIAHLFVFKCESCLLYTSPSPRDATLSRMPSSA